MKIHYETSSDNNRFTVVSLRGRVDEQTYRSWFTDRMTTWQHLDWAPELLGGGPHCLEGGEWCAVVQLKKGGLSRQQMQLDLKASLR